MSRLKKIIPLAVREKYRAIEFRRNRRLLQQTEESRIMIIGCGRSGTTFTSKLFKAHGFSVGHERLLQHGISSWLLVSNQDTVHIGPSYSEIKDLGLPVVHQVRHPIKAIASFLSTGHKSWEFIANEIPIDYDNDNKVLRGMKYWYYWNLMAEKKATFTYQVEKLDEVFPELLRIGQFPVSFAKGEEVAKTTNTRPHSILNWDDLKNENIELTNKIIDLAKRYGYDVE